MPRIKIKDYDEQFRSSNSPTVLNDPVSINSTKDVNDLVSKVMQTDQEISFAESCQCGFYRGTSRHGLVCPKCGTEVSSNFINTMDNKLWIKIPNDFPPVLNPRVYGVLNGWIKDCIQTILNTRLKKSSAFVRKEISGRGFQFFYENFDEIIETLARAKMKKAKTEEDEREVKDILRFVKEYRDVAFCRHLPVLDSAFSTSTSKGDMKYIDQTSKHILKAVHDLSRSEFIYLSVKESGRKRDKGKIIQKSLEEIYFSYITYGDDIIRLRLNAKKGLPKHHGMGVRLGYTARAVIVPIIGPHMADQVEMPWRVFLIAYENEIRNLLQSRFNRTPEEIDFIIRRSPFTYNEEIEEISKIMIQETSLPSFFSTKHGLPVLIGRNPTIEHGGVQLLCATKVKTDPFDETLGFSTTIAKRPNADYDGDILYIISLKEMLYVVKYKRLHPSFTILSQKSPEVDTSLMPCKQLCVQLQSYFQYSFGKSECGPTLQFKRKR